MSDEVSYTLFPKPDSGQLSPERLAHYANRMREWASPDGPPVLCMLYHRFRAGADGDGPMMETGKLLFAGSTRIYAKDWDWDLAIQDLREGERAVLFSPSGFEMPEEGGNPLED